MSANLDLVRSIYAAWQRGDYSSAEWADEEIEHVVADGPTAGRRTGRAGMARAWREMLSPWEELRIDPDEYIEVDAARVLVLNHFKGRGKTSGIDASEIQGTAANLFQIRDGKVIRLAQYWDQKLALADAGLDDEER